MSEKKISIKKIVLIELLLVAVSAAMFSLILKEQSLGYLSLISLVVPIVIIIKTSSIKMVLTYGIVYGFVYYFTLNDFFVPLLGFSREWVFTGWLISSIYLSLFTAGAFLMIKVIHRRFKNQVLIWFLWSAVWVGFEFFRMFGFLSFPFGTVGNSLIGTSLQGGASLWGWAGLSFLVFGFNAFVVLAIYSLINKKYAEIIYVSIIISILLFVSWSTVPTEIKPKVRISAVQTDFDSFQKFDDRQNKLNTKKVFSLAKEAYKKRTELIFLPETVFGEPSDILSRELPEADIVFGSFRRTSGKIFNSAFMKQGSIKKALYDKNEPVLFGEYVPLKFFYQYLPLGRSLSFGKTNGVFKVKNIKIGIVICSEISSPFMIRNQALHGARLLAVISNNQWFTKGTMRYQLFQLARLRAIESGRYLVQSANGGYTSVIKPNGDIESVKEQGIGIVIGKVAFISKKTVYTLFGWIFPYIAAIINGFVLIYEFVWKLKS